MAWLPDGEKNLKISLFVLTQLTNVTDTQTDRHRMTAQAALLLCIASRGKNQSSLTPQAKPAHLVGPPTPNSLMGYSLKTSIPGAATDGGNDGSKEMQRPRTWKADH